MPSFNLSPHKCPAGHSMSPTTLSDWHCDLCHSSFLVSSLSTARGLGCRTCDFDVCLQCLNKNGQQQQNQSVGTALSRKVVEPMKVETCVLPFGNCPNDHLLERTKLHHCHCDVCHHERQRVDNDGDADMFGCRVCDFDICVSCLNDRIHQYNYRESSDNDTGCWCPAGHKLNVTTLTNWHCDVCSTSYLRNHNMLGLGCRECDVDICATCFAGSLCPSPSPPQADGSGSPTQKDTNSAAAGCPGCGQDLWPTNLTFWTCDICRADFNGDTASAQQKQAGPAGVGCRRCDFDICQSCLQSGWLDDQQRKRAAATAAKATTQAKTKSDDGLDDDDGSTQDPSVSVTLSDRLKNEQLRADVLQFTSFQMQQCGTAQQGGQSKLAYVSTIKQLPVFTAFSTMLQKTYGSASTLETIVAAALGGCGSSSAAASPPIPTHILKLGFHGTKDIRAAASIIKNGFDPRRRSGQVYGPGEYFDVDLAIAMTYAGTNGAIIGCLLVDAPNKNPGLRNTHSNQGNGSSRSSGGGFGNRHNPFARRATASSSSPPASPSATVVSEHKYHNGRRIYVVDNPLDVTADGTHCLPVIVLGPNADAVVAML